MVKVKVAMSMRVDYSFTTDVDKSTNELQAMSDDEIAEYLSELIDPMEDAVHSDDPEVTSLSVYENNSWKKI